MVIKWVVDSSDIHQQLAVGAAYLCCVKILGFTVDGCLREFHVNDPQTEYQ